MTIRPELIDKLRTKRTQLTENVSPEKLEELHAKGLLSARERLGTLFVEGTFQELGLHASHSATNFGMATKTLPADGVVCGTGYVGAMQVAAFSQDFSVVAGTLGKMQARKINRTMRHALRNGVPVVAFKDSGGARIQEGVDALSGYGDVFYSNVLLSGVVPQIAVICGPCAGGAAYSPALMDFVIMTRENAHMFLTGPQVIKAVTGRATTMAEVGGAEMHATISGNAHFIAEDDQHAIGVVKQLLSYLPSNNTEDPPHDLTVPIEEMEDPGINDCIPDSPSEPLDMYAVIRRLVDNGELLEVHAGFARNIIVGFARISGVVVGLIANQPMVMAGALDLNAADKVARFVRTCNVFNVPVVTLVDVPGFLPGVNRSAAASFATARKCFLPTARAPRRKLRSSCARPTVARISPCAARKWARTWSSPGQRPRSRSWARKRRSRFSIARKSRRPRINRRKPPKWRRSTVRSLPHRTCRPATSISPTSSSPRIRAGWLPWPCARYSTSVNSGRPRNTATSPCNRRRKEKTP